MRGLIVAGAPSAGSDGLIARLAGDADVVIGVDSGTDVAFGAGVSVTLVVGDLDSISPSGLARARELGAEVIRFPAEKDETDLELALEVAQERGLDEIVVTAAFSGRLDHTLAALGAVVRHGSAAVRIAEPHFSACVLDAKGRDSGSVDPAGSVFSLIAIGGRARVDCCGAKWPLQDAWLEPLSGLGVSNVVVGAEAKVKVREGTVLLVRPVE
jgi:thiamine pyrophosphokinase